MQPSNICRVSLDVLYRITECIVQIRVVLRYSGVNQRDLCSLRNGRACVHSGRCYANNNFIMAAFKRTAVMYIKPGAGMVAVLSPTQTVVLSGYEQLKY